MDYLLIEDGVIVNIIVCEDDETAALFGAVPSYEGATIGAAYAPPPPEPEKPTIDQRVETLETDVSDLTKAIKTPDALASAIYVSRQTLDGVSITTDDQRIRASGLYDDWAAGNHQVGDIYNAVGQTWECHAAYDNAVYPDVTPGSSAWPTFNRPLHGKTRETAREFVQPQNGTTDIYHVGEWAIFEGDYVVALRDTNFSPADYPADWKTMPDSDTE